MVVDLVSEFSTLTSVAAKELRLSYYIKETPLVSIYPNHVNLNYVPCKPVVRLLALLVVRYSSLMEAMKCHWTRQKLRIRV